MPPMILPDSPSRCHTPCDTHVPVDFRPRPSSSKIPWGAHGLAMSVGDEFRSASTLPLSGLVGGVMVLISCTVVDAR